MSFNINNALAIIAANAVVDAVDNGALAGTIQIRTGAPPATVDLVDTGTLLGTLTFSDPAFGAAVDANPGAIATANAITDDTSADATGTAGYFRVFDSDAVGIFQGTIGVTGSGDPLELNSVAITIGSAISITSFTVTMPE